MKAKENYKWEILLLVFSVFMLIPLGVVGWFDRPSADDFDYAMMTHQAVMNHEGLLGVIAAAWNTVVYYFLNWQGTYTSAFLMSLQPGIWGERFYFLTPFIILGIEWIFLFGSFSIINRRFFHGSVLFTMLLTTIALSVLNCHLPSIKEGLFWYNGAVHYMPGMYCAFLIFSLTMDALFQPLTKSTTKKIILSSLLGFLVSGTAQSSAFFNLALLFVTVCIGFKRKRGLPLLPFLTAVIGFIIMRVAPGTCIRQSVLNQSSFLTTILASAQMAITQFSQLFSTQWFLAMTLIFPFALHWAVNTPKESLPASFPWISIVVSAAIYCGMLCVPFYAMGNFGPGRVQNCFFLSFTVMTGYDFALIIGWLVRHDLFSPSWIALGNNETKKSIIVLLSMLLLLLPSYYAKSNPMQAIDEYHYGRCMVFAREIDARTVLYKDPTLSNVEILPLSNYDSLLISSELSLGDPNVWPNKSVAEYYGKDTVRFILPQEETIPHEK